MTSRRASRHRRPSEAAVRALIGVLIAVATVLSPVPATAQSPFVGVDIPVPNFWDPSRRIEQPPAGAVTSLRFITTDDFPPFNFLDAGGQLTGFNVDLARAICDRLEVPCTIQAREWGELIDRLEDGTADMAIAGIAITAAHRWRLDFSDVYMRLPGRFVARREDRDLAPTEAALRSRTVAVMEKTAHEAFLAALLPDVERRAFPTRDAAREALRLGQADVLFGDGVQLSFWMQSEAAHECCVFVGGPYLESRFFGQGLAIAMPKGSPARRQAINAALRQIHASGEYAELYLRYFPIGVF